MKMETTKKKLKGFFSELDLMSDEDRKKIGKVRRRINYKKQRLQKLKSEFIDKVLSIQKSEIIDTSVYKMYLISDDFKTSFVYELLKDKLPYDEDDEHELISRVNGIINAIEKDVQVLEVIYHGRRDDPHSSLRRSGYSTDLVNVEFQARNEALYVLKKMLDG